MRKLQCGVNHCHIKYCKTSVLVCINKHTLCLPPAMPPFHRSLLLCPPPPRVSFSPIEWGVVAFRIERQALSRENPSCCRFEALAICFTKGYHNSFICINEYLAIWAVNVCKYDLRAVIAAWLSASQRSRDGVGKDRCARGEV